MTLDPPPAEEAFGFGFDVDEPEATAAPVVVTPAPKAAQPESPETRRAKKQSKRIAKAFGKFGASTGRKTTRDNVGAAAAATANAVPAAAPPTPASYTECTSKLLDDVLGQYVAQNTHLAEKPQSKIELPAFLKVRNQLQAWTGYDIGCDGSLAIQNGFVEFFIECADWVEDDGSDHSIAHLDAAIDSWVAVLELRGSPDAAILGESIAGFRSALTTCRQKMRLWRSRGGM
jgi:hypothetical protein